MAPARYPDIGTHTSRSRKPSRIINCCLERERGDRADTGYGHEPLDLRITARQLHNFTVELTDLPLDGVARFEQRPDRSNQLGTMLDQLLGSHGEDIERGTADHLYDVFEKAAHIGL